MLNLNEQVQVSNQNREAVIKSALLAKAVIKTPNGDMKILAVFSESTTFEFYWMFRLQGTNPHARRSKWEKPNHGVKANYRTFDDFVTNILALSKGTLVFKKIYKKKILLAVYKAQTHSSINHKWESIQPTTPQDFRLVQERASKAFKQHGFYFNTRNTSLDTLPKQSNDEVYVYKDHCETCMCDHLFAHYPNGRKECKQGYSELHKHPAFEYKGHNNTNGFIFIYKSSQIIGGSHG